MAALAANLKQSEKALRQSEQRYRLLFDRNLAGLFHSTLDGRILDCNESFARKATSQIRLSSRSQRASRSAASLVKSVCKLGIKFPAVVVTFDNATERAYTRWPDRLYVIDRDGRVVYKSRPGPFGFQPQGVAETLQRLIPEKH